MDNILIVGNMFKKNSLILHTCFNVFHHGDSTFNDLHFFYLIMSRMCSKNNFRRGKILCLTSFLSYFRFVLLLQSYKHESLCLNYHKLYTWFILLSFMLLHYYNFNIFKIWYTVYTVYESASFEQIRK